MNRRQFLGGVGTTAMVSIAGCSEGLSTSETTQSATSGSESQTATTTTTASVLGNEDDPWTGYIAHLSGDASVDIREVLDSPVSAVLTGDEIQTVFVKGEAEAIVDAVENSDYNLESVSQAQWKYGSVCEMKSRLQLPEELSFEQLDSTFPNAIGAFTISMAGSGTFRLVYSRLQSEAEIESRLEELGVGMESATVYVYNDCNRISSQD